MNKHIGFAMLYIPGAALCGCITGIKGGSWWMAVGLGVLWGAWCAAGLLLMHFMDRRGL